MQVKVEFFSLADEGYNSAKFDEQARKNRTAINTFLANVEFVQALQTGDVLTIFYREKAAGGDGTITGG